MFCPENVYFISNIKEAAIIVQTMLQSPLRENCDKASLVTRCIISYGIACYVMFRLLLLHKGMRYSICHTKPVLPSWP